MASTGGDFVECGAEARALLVANRRSLAAIADRSPAGSKRNSGSGLRQWLARTRDRGKQDAGHTVAASNRRGLAGGDLRESRANAGGVQELL